MKILLDESVPKRLGKEIVGHQVSTVVNKGWSGKKNGELLRLAEKEFEIFLTVDQNLQYQQNVHGYNIAIVVLSASSNSFEVLKPHIPKLLKFINVGFKVGKVYTIK